MKINQIAIYVPDQHKAMAAAEEIFSGLEFYSDQLQMHGEFLKKQIAAVDLLLSFTHNLMDGVELEYITSSSKHHWHDELISTYGTRPFLSHLGAYVSTQEFAMLGGLIEAYGYQRLQYSKSFGHSNKREDGSERHYADAIYNTHRDIGFNIKLSTRIPQ